MSDSTYDSRAMTNSTSFMLSLQGSAILGEFLSFFVPIITAGLLALWRTAANRSNLQKILIEAIVRGINSGSENIRGSDTNVVKRAVKAEAEEAGVQQHLEKVVEKVKSETNGRDGGDI